MVIKDGKLYGKLAQQDGKIFIHFLKAQTISAESLEMMLPEAPLVFLELSQDGVVQGRVFVRLDKDLPNIKENIPTIFSGKRGKSLAGIKLSYHTTIKNPYLHSSTSSLKDIPVKCDINGSSDAKCGDVAGYVCRGYLEHLFLLDGSYKFDKDLCRVFGNIESCMDILQECCKRRTVKEITDCGLVLERG